MKLFKKSTTPSLSREREFEGIYNMYARKIYGFAIRMSKGDTYMAEEILQTTFMRLWEHWDELKDRDAVLAYLFSTAKNTFLNYCEHELIEFIYADYILAHQSDSDSHMEDSLDAHFLEEYLRDIIRQMPPMRQKVFVMSRDKHMSNREIAQELHISENTVQVHINLALRELRDKLKD